MNDDATLTLMSIGRCFVGALHGPSDKANDKVSVVNWNSGIRGAITQILQRTTLRASYRHAAQHKCCARALSPLWVKKKTSQHVSVDGSFRRKQPS
jgi:hypothetical protein